MAAYFQLIRRTTNEPAGLVSVDNEMCRWFGVIPDDVRYFRQWYDVIGFSLAMGNSMEQVKYHLLYEYRNDELYAVAVWLDRHFTPKAWYGR